MRGILNFVLNIIWLICGGLILALGYLLFGVLACILIITIPAGVASFRMAGFALWPFGRTVVVSQEGSGGLAGISNVIWFVIAGLWLSLGHIATAVVQAITIIGIPVAIANIRMIPVTCFPFGKHVVASDRIPHGYRPMIAL